MHPEGFKAMVPAIMILTFAWTLKAMTDSLGAAVFVEEAMRSVAGGIEVILPAIISWLDVDLHLLQVLPGEPLVS